MQRQCGLQRRVRKAAMQLWARGALQQLCRTRQGCAVLQVALQSESGRRRVQEVSKVGRPVPCLPEDFSGT